MRKGKGKRRISRRRTLANPPERTKPSSRRSSAARPPPYHKSHPSQEERLEDDGLIYPSISVDGYIYALMKGDPTSNLQLLLEISPYIGIREGINWRKFYNRNSINIHGLGNMIRAERRNSQLVFIDPRTEEVETYLYAPNSAETIKTVLNTRDRHSEIDKMRQCLGLKNDKTLNVVGRVNEIERLHSLEGRVGGYTSDIDLTLQVAQEYITHQKAIINQSLNMLAKNLSTANTYSITNQIIIPLKIVWNYFMDIIILAQLYLRDPTIDQMVVVVGATHFDSIMRLPLVKDKILRYTSRADHGMIDLLGTLLKYEKQVSELESLTPRLPRVSIHQGEATFSRERETRPAKFPFPPHHHQTEILGRRISFGLEPTVDRDMVMPIGETERTGFHSLPIPMDLRGVQRFAQLGINIPDLEGPRLVTLLGEYHSLMTPWGLTDTEKEEENLEGLMRQHLRPPEKTY